MLSTVIEQHAKEMNLFRRFHLQDLLHNCTGELRCALRCFFPAFDEGDHEDIVGKTTHLTNVDVNRQST